MRLNEMRRKAKHIKLNKYSVIRSIIKFNKTFVPATIIVEDVAVVAYDAVVAEAAALIESEAAVVVVVLVVAVVEEADVVE